MNDLQIRNQLAEQWMEIIRPLAIQISRNTGADVDDLTSEGYVALVKACGTVDVHRSDPEIKAYLSRAAREDMLNYNIKERKAGLVDAPEPKREVKGFDPDDTDDTDDKITEVSFDVLDNIPVEFKFYGDDMRDQVATRIRQWEPGPLRATFLCILAEPYATKTQIARALSKAFKKEFTKDGVDYLIEMGRKKLHAF